MTSQSPTTVTESGVSGSNDEPTLTINDTELTPIGAQVDVNNVTVTFENGELQYPGGVSAEILTTTDEYTEVTGSFEGRFDSAFRFRVYDNDEKPWFHKADFWPYTDDSADNLFHHIRYAYTHTRNTDITLHGIDRDAITYPFTEHAVIAFFDPDEERVRVFTGEEGCSPASDVARRVFQPKLSLYVEYEGELLEIRVRAKGYNDPDSEPQYETEEIDTAHLRHPCKATMSTTGSVLWDPTDYRVSGPVWEFLKNVSRDAVCPIRTDGFKTCYHLFRNPDIDTPETR